MRSTAVAVFWVGLILIGCTASVATTPNPDSGATQTADTTPTVAPSMLASTTVAATEAPAGSTHVVMVGPPPVFRPKTLTIDHSDVVFYLQNDSPSEAAHGAHTLAIGQEIGSPLVVSDEVKGGKRAVFTVQGLEPGASVIWCTLFGHSSLGQKGDVDSRVARPVAGDARLHWRRALRTPDAA
jgi:plastocyanin